MSAPDHPPTASHAGPGFTAQIARALEKRPRLALWVALALVALAHAGALSGPFVWDDVSLIVDQALVREAQPLRDFFLKLFWSDPTSGQIRDFYRPLTTLSYALDWRLWSGNSVGFHLTNLLLHLLCCALVFLLARRAGAAAVAAGVLTALFGTFPRLTESVSWISGRTDLIASSGVLMALLVHRSEPSKSVDRILAATAVFLGLLGKEVAAAGVVGIAVVEFLARPRNEGRAWRGLLLRLLPALVACTGYLALRALATVADASSHLRSEPAALGVLGRTAAALQALGSYAVMLADPLRPRLQTGRLGVVEPALVLAGLVALAAAVAGTVRIVRRRASPLHGALVLTAWAALLPVLHIVPLSRHVVAADRFLYLPLATLAPLLASALTAPDRGGGWRRSFLAASSLGLLAAFAIATRLRAAEWSNEMVLWNRAVATSPHLNSLPLQGRGGALLKRGRPAEALADFERALTIDAELSRLTGRNHPTERVRHNVALCLDKLGRRDEAAEILDSLVHDFPERRRYRYNLASVEARRLRFDRAENLLREAVALHPDDPIPASLMRRFHEAQETLDALPSESPGDAVEVRARRAQAFELLGRDADAARLWASVALEPTAAPPLRWRGALYVVSKGALDEAQTLVETLRRERLEGDRLKVLEDDLAARRGDH